VYVAVQRTVDYSTYIKAVYDHTGMYIIRHDVNSMHIRSNSNWLASLAGHSFLFARDIINNHNTTILTSPSPSPSFLLASFTLLACEERDRERSKDPGPAILLILPLYSIIFVSNERTGRTITSREHSTKSRGSRTRHTSSSGSRGTEKTSNITGSHTSGTSGSSYSNYFALKSNAANKSSHTNSSSSSLSSKFAKWTRKVQGNLCGASLPHLPSLEEDELQHSRLSVAEKVKIMERPMPEKPPRASSVSGTGAAGIKHNYSNSRVKASSGAGNAGHHEQEFDTDHDHHTFATATTASATISYSTDQGDSSDVSEAGMEVVMSDRESGEMEDSIVTAIGPYQSHSFAGGKHTFTVDKRYSLIRVIGSGAYGVVISSNDTKTDTNVAIKMVPKCFSDEIDAKRILREIKLLKHFRHDNIVQIMDMMPPNVKCLEDFTDVYIVADLMETDLHRIIYSKQKLSMDHVQYFVYQVMRGLKYIHSCKVLHRDLKPSNLLVNANCDLKICDFGLARGIRDKDEEGGGGTMLLTEYVVTRWYRAPEIMLACHEYSYPVDVWSVGCIFAELVLRKPYFPGDDYIDQVRSLSVSLLFYSVLYLPFYFFNASPITHTRHCFSLVL
jgi:tRNA A-37 threonylcarbamoyl transferase component Bud32